LDEIPSDPLPRLLGVARRVAANRRRGERRSAALISRLQDEARVRAGVVEDDLDARTIRALSTLSESDQELLLLVAWEGLNRVQLARLLGLRTGALAVRLHRARRRFADALEKEDAGAEASSARSPAMEVR